MSKNVDSGNFNSFESTYMTRSEIAKRWQCSLTSVSRIAQSNGFKRFVLGEAERSSVRYLRKEVFAYEESRLI